jgi:regulator of cell morphogenesis and NO signaling
MAGAAVDPSTSLAELAVSHPAAARVFRRHRLDFCCGGRRPLDEVCRERQLDAGAILAAIAEEDPLEPDQRRWDEVPLSALVEHIVSVYHMRLREQLPALVAMARRVEARHPDKGSCPRGLTAHLEAMHEAVLEHLQKEEQILFPLIAAGLGHRAGGPVHVMEIEHEHHGDDLQRVRQLTGDLIPPDEACTTWRALYLGLQQREQELMDHIHLENNILFRRALAS